MRNVKNKQKQTQTNETKALLKKTPIPGRPRPQQSEDGL
uniref:Uncharacterized protein n=1 Tax=Anguilla anguilla TaxID=7936 RepID=A0A0E9PT98_ANGAN